MHPPSVHLNVAASVDGRIALADGSPADLSGDEDWERVHGLRSRADAVLVGVGTVLADDPHLTARPGGQLAPEQPLRVVLDSGGRTPREARVLDGAAPTLLVTVEGADVDRVGADVVEAGAGTVDLEGALEALGDRGVEEVLVEGGGRVAGSFLRAGLFDTFTLYVAPTVVGGDAPGIAPRIGATSDEEALDLDLESVERLGEGVLLRYGGPR